MKAGSFQAGKLIKGNSHHLVREEPTIRENEGKKPLQIITLRCADRKEGNLACKKILSAHRHS